MSLAQLSKLLPLPESDLQQVLDYAATLSKQDAAEHFNNLLGESPQSIEFISSFNSRRQDPTSSSSTSHSTPQTNDTGVPKPIRKGPKKKAPLHTPAPRQIQDTYAAQGTAYVKKNEDDYISKRPYSGTNNASSSSQPTTSKTSTPPPKQPPSASGTLISSTLAPPKPKSKPNSSSSSRNASPSKQSTTIKIPGGPPMHGSSTTLSEIDTSIRLLELSTNSTLLPSSTSRRCTCNATRHPLLAAAPNCLHCGKIICVKEGLGPCTFCNTPLLAAEDVQGMIRELKEERGREKMALDRRVHRRADVGNTPRPFSSTASSNTGILGSGLSPAEQAAQDHRDKLLGFQAENAQRTTVRDEAADFDVPVIGGGNLNAWASPAERARELKRQQKVLAEMEWNARPEYEKARTLVSLDLVGGKVVKRMGRVERERAVEVEESEREEEGDDQGVLREGSGNVGGGTFSRNPLLGGLIKPVYPVEEGSKEQEPRKKTWRRVQDNLEDNEDVILDGGVYGGGTGTTVDGQLGGDEPACG